MEAHSSGSTCRTHPDPVPESYDGSRILLLRRPIVEMFLANPPKEVIWYSNGYLNWVAPCYLILGALSIYRCAVQSMQNTAAPFIACMIELVMRIGSTLFICSLWGYTGVCIATPLAWIGAGSYVMFVYYNSMQRKMLPADCLSDTVRVDVKTVILTVNKN